MANSYKAPMALSSPASRSRIKSRDSGESRDLQILLGGNNRIKTTDLSSLPLARKRQAGSLGVSAATTPVEAPVELNVEVPKFEDFEVMAADVRRLVSTWINNNSMAFKAAQQELLNEKRRVEEERIKMLKDLEETKQYEYERIKETRLRAEQEMASMTKQIASEREQSRQKLAEDRKALEAEKNSFRRTLRMEQERLKKSQDAFDLERKRIVDANIATQTMVEMNVGGAIFETARQTLTQFQDSYLACLFSGRHEIERDRSGRIFIDRDAGLFRSILNFLRDPEILPLPKSSAESDELCREAAFYGVKFFPYPLVIAFGGHDGSDYLKSCESLDITQNCWKFSASMETPRAYFASGALLNKFYVAGGQNFDYKALCDVEVYDALLDTWIPGPGLLYPRKSTTGAVLSDRFYVAGGFDGASILGTVEFLDHRTRNWIEAAPMKTPRSSAILVAKGEHELIVLGGSTGERLRTGERYDARADRWEPLPADMVEIRSGASAGTLFDCVYVLGGIDSSQRVLDSMETFDFSAPQWGFRKTFAHPVVDSSACSVSGSMIVAGGQAYGEVFKDVSFYRPELDEWQPGPDLGQRRFGHALVCAQI
eukprot:Gregarina_sp_Poly_1__399@NODE_109_length_14014_cov_141_998351_g96_i0_p4_GENE_NODE_109_length_14014_cov_141_998351_g96_i0NODE_109_length_14014_cov_141_998351_g96_i0_p4_ORF_typecomplete_len599_score97_13Kelch_1/PF01344_25/1_7e06Kelch_1/PF01344_25/5_8e08Kelch_1/PF01344_25/1_2e08Kelch_1/PF01344_25/3_6e05Kelch_1/PF01344_25/3_7e06Kelch_1/PF01344_25/4_1e05Kelch_6/PF13964_6/0_0045Kelch_6/PF13964_6/0_0085Kelch_6/PF13964_6/1e05Kelch_6/PF13964_6/0_011Kelch_6/PF13964_6/0_098Kelch_6/PF13964_6/0_00042Kelch_4/